jgi:hypothetical protein
VNHELTPEDSALLAALAALESAPATGGTAVQPALAPHVSPDPALPANATGLDDGGAEARETLRTLTRLYHETLGLVPFGLPPMAPRPQVKRRLMSAIAIAGAAAPIEPLQAAQAPSRAPEAGGASGAVSEAATPAPPAAPLPFARLPAAAPPVVAPRRRSPRAYRFGLGLAAALILALLATCGWFYRGLLEQAATIARLGDERDAARRQAQDLAARLARQAVAMTGMRQSFSVVTSPAVEVCALRPVAPDAGDAHGILFVAADHQHWYMSLRGLHPAQEGKIYQLWFVGPQGPKSGGTFNARSGQPWELGAEHMPEGTREITITLETGTGSLTPNGPAMFRNSDLFRVS